MPLSDYVNFNPAPEATGGYNPGGLGVTVDDLLNASRAIDFYNQANTMGVTPFESNQIYRNQLNPTSVSTGFAASGGAETNPFLGAILGPTNISATGTAGGLPSNIFQGPLPTMGGAGINALYNLGSAGLNYLGNIGVNQVALGNLPAGNIGMETGFNPNYPNLSTAGVTITNPAEMTGNVTFDTGGIGQAQTGGVMAGQQAGGQMGGQVGGAGVTMLPAVNVTAPGVSTGADISSLVNQGAGSLIGGQGGIVSLPPMTVSAPPATGTPVTQTPTTTVSKVTPPSDVTTLPAVTVSAPPVSTVTAQPTNIFANIKAPTEAVGPFAPPKVTIPSSTATTTQTTATTSTSIPTTTVGDVGGGITYNPSAGQVAGGMAQRDLAAELAKSYAALSGQQGNLMNMYGGIYQNLLGQTAIPQAAQQSLAQMQADAAKLQRIQSGQMNAEDIRQAQQAAREAYGARGQVMGQGAIGAEILNREAIRQQRENEARNAYQASMGNVFNAAQLQTGNIFSPIGQLVSGTFNPLGAYPQDVYSSNVNAQLARDIAAANNAAAIEAAKYGATQAKQAATTSAIGNVLGKLIGLG